MSSLAILHLHEQTTLHINGQLTKELELERKLLQKSLKLPTTKVTSLTQMSTLNHYLCFAAEFFIVNELTWLKKIYFSQCRVTEVQNA